MERSLRFETLKEGRKTYFIEYRPPITGYRFATLQLIYPTRGELADVVEDMEREALHWNTRFPIPLMVSAFDELGDLIRLDGIRDCNHLMAFRDSSTEKLERHWRLMSDSELPTDGLNRDRLLRVYAGVSVKTESQIRHEALNKARRLRLGWTIVVGWIALAPIGLLVIEFFGPEWLAAILFVYALWKATVKALKLLGKWKPSSAEVREQEEEQRRRHYFYHCERNPEGFQRLKFENFDREQKEEIAREATALMRAEVDSKK
jgi:hypothetical protein